MSGYGASVREFCFPSCILCSSESELICLWEILSREGYVWELQKDINLIFSLYYLFLRICFFSLCSCREFLGAVVSWNLPDPIWSRLSQCRSCGLAPAPISPTRKLCSDSQVGIGAGCSGGLRQLCDPVTDVSLPSTTPSPSLRKWAAEGLHKPELLIQHQSSAASPCAVHSFAAQSNDVDYLLE